MRRPATDETGVGHARIRALAARAQALPALLLVCVAILQIALAREAALSPWSGGGFGMFASTDSPARRHLHAWALRPGLRSELEVPRELERDARRALALPVPALLRPLALELARIEEREGDPDAAPVEGIAIQVFRLHYAAPGLAPGGEEIGSFEIPVRDR